MITNKQAYIAVTPSGFVDGACFSESKDAQDWCREMKAAGLEIQIHERKKAKKMLFTHIAKKSSLVA